MPAPFTIQLFATTGDPAGVRIVEKSNWSGVGLAFSRGGARGGAMQNMASVKEIKALKVLIPPLQEQVEIVRRAEQLFAFADQLEARVSASQKGIGALVQSLLAKAFRGELVPQDPNDEPASALLERIRAQRAAAATPGRGRKAAAD